MPTPVIPINNWGDAVFLATTNALNMFLAAIPLIVGALIVLVIGWLLSNVLGSLTTRLLTRAGADRLFARHGPDVYGSVATSWQPSVVAAEVIKWVIRLIFLIAAANILGLTQVSQLLNQVILQ